MQIAFTRVVGDYLALHGESPDLLPELQEGEDSAVLTIERQLRARLLPAAIEATLAVPPESLDTMKSASLAVTSNRAGYCEARAPSDYLRIYSLRMADWREPVWRPEEPGSLRHCLGANAPAWMVCPERPMVIEERDHEGVLFKLYATAEPDIPARLRYIPLPVFDGEFLIISQSAYCRLLCKCL